MNFKLLAGLLVAVGLAIAAFGLLSVGDTATSAPATQKKAAEQAAGVAPEQDAGSVAATNTARKVAAATPAGNRGDIASRLLALRSPRDREKFLDETFRALAQNGQEAALAALDKLPDDEAKSTAMLALLSEWTGQTTLEMIRGGDVWRFGAAGALAVWLMKSGRITPQQAVAMAQNSSGANMRGELLSTLAGGMAASDPAGAYALGDTLSGWEKGRFVSRFAESWSSADPDAARSWAAQQTDPWTRDAARNGIIDARLAQNDPASAAQAFVDLPPEDQRAKGWAARRVAEAWAGKDTLSAMQWADSLTDPAAQNAARDGISRVAPVGIGAALNNGPGGVPVVSSVVPGSPASASGAMKAGDQVLAVTDSSGAWVDSTSMPLGQVTSLIRGEANTQVSIRVQSPGESSSRVVVLGRQQIIFRPQ